MVAAKEKTVSFKSGSDIEPMGNKSAHPTATKTPSTVVNRISSYDFRTRKFKKSPIGSSEKIHLIVAVGAHTKPRKYPGENAVHLRRSRWAPELSLYRAYFVPGGVDPTGKSSRPVGSDDQGRPIIQIVADIGGEWGDAGFSVGDCFVWDPITKTRTKVNCPKDVIHTGFVGTINLGDSISDPGPSCFCEGYYRHCINSCILHNATISVWGGPGHGWFTQFIAQWSGNDLPGDPKRDPCDIEANQTGIDIAIAFGNNGPWDGSVLRNCAGRCSLAFLTKFNKECCPKHPNKKKTDPCGCKE